MFHSKPHMLTKLLTARSNILTFPTLPASMFSRSPTHSLLRPHSHSTCRRSIASGCVSEPAPWPPGLPPPEPPRHPPPFQWTTAGHCWPRLVTAWPPTGLRNATPATGHPCHRPPLAPNRTALRGSGSRDPFTARETGPG